MVKWIDVMCTNSGETWEGGAGAYNEGSLQTDFYPGAMGFCGLSLAYDNKKFRYMCFTNGGDNTRCYGDDSYQNDLETVMSCTDDYPGNFRPRLTGMKIWTKSDGNDGFRGAEFYFDQSWECSNVQYISHDTASQSATAASELGLRHWPPFVCDVLLLHKSGPRTAGPPEELERDKAVQERCLSPSEGT